jgi:hypothetical protein
VYVAAAVFAVCALFSALALPARLNIKHSK